jgi:flagellar basal-body rod protein FlgG
MISQQRRHDAVTNNIANLNTPGYKQTQTVNRSFPEMLIQRMGGDSGNRPRRIGLLNTGVLAEENIPIYMQGDLVETRSPGDLAIVSDIMVDGVVFDAAGKGVGPDGRTVYQPQAFFMVRNEAGEVRYTRNGRFSQNEAGELVTVNGLPVLGANGQPIVLNEPLSDLAVTATGEFRNARTGEAITDAAGEPLRLGLARVDDPTRLIREGDGLFRPEAGAELELIGPADRVDIRQGFYERSNVDPAQSMVELTAALRAYEANQKIVQFYDRSLEKAVNEVGKV